MTQEVDYQVRATLLIVSTGGIVDLSQDWGFTIHADNRSAQISSRRLKSNEYIGLRSLNPFRSS
jgi:hypothetical protein